MRVNLSTDNEQQLIPSCSNKLQLSHINTYTIIVGFPVPEVNKARSNLANQDTRTRGSGACILSSPICLINLISQAAQIQNATSLFFFFL